MVHQIHQRGDLQQEQNIIKLGKDNLTEIANRYDVGYSNKKNGTV
jgi:predicted methyltransferase